MKEMMRNGVLIGTGAKTNLMVRGTLGNVQKLRLGEL